MRTDKELEGVNNKKTCGKCGKNYVSVSNLNRHLLKCLYQEKFICEYCKHEFTQKYNLTTHLLICKSY